MNELKKNILVVDDEKNIRLTILQALSCSEFNIVTAESGEKALEILQELPVQCLFLDLKLPGISGIDVLKKIQEGYPQTPAIIISAHGTIESAVEALKIGAKDFIQKPFTPQELRNAAKHWISATEGQGDRKPPFDFQLAEAKALLRAGNKEEARRAISRMLFWYPEHPHPYNCLGVLAEMNNHSDEAQKFYRAALDMQATFTPAQKNLERLTMWDRKESRIYLDMEDRNEDAESEK